MLGLVFASSGQWAVSGLLCTQRHRCRPCGGLVAQGGLSDCSPPLHTTSCPCAFSSCCLQGPSAPSSLCPGAPSPARPCPSAPGRWHGLPTPLAFLSSVCATQPAGCVPSLAHTVFISLFRTFASKGTGWDSVHFVCSCSPSGCQQRVMLAPGGQFWMSPREEGARGI